MISWENIEKRCVGCSHYYFGVWDKTDARGFENPEFSGRCALAELPFNKVSLPEFKVPDACPYILEFVLERGGE